MLPWHKRWSDLPNVPVATFRADPHEDAIWNEIATGVVAETDHRCRANALRRRARRSGGSCAVCRPSAGGAPGSGSWRFPVGAVGPARTMRRTRTRPTLVIREGPVRRWSPAHCRARPLATRSGTGSYRSKSRAALEMACNQSSSGCAPRSRSHSARTRAPAQPVIVAQSSLNATAPKCFSTDPAPSSAPSQSSGGWGRAKAARPAACARR